jgi:hypothetical protein
VSSAAVSVTDARYSYRSGLVNFNLTCATGSTAQVTLYFYGLDSAHDLIVRKFDARTNTYTTISDATTSTTTIGGLSAVKVTYAIVDGGLLDQDGIVDGIIDDPVGVAYLLADTPATVSDTSVISPNTGVQPASKALPLILVSGGAILAACWVVWRRKHDSDEEL